MEPAITWIVIRKRSQYVPPVRNAAQEGTKAHPDVIETKPESIPLNRMLISQLLYKYLFSNRGRIEPPAPARVVFIPIFPIKLPPESQKRKKKSYAHLWPAIRIRC